jgi:ferredoxin-NADP reductase
MGIAAERKSAIEAAPETPLPAVYPINRLAGALHPAYQYLLIEDIQDHGCGAKSYTLIADKEKGTESPAYFNAGQYIGVLLEINGSKLFKPYSIRSAPAEALEGRYVITVKQSEDGFASSFILDNWKKGDRVTATGPEGNFTFEPLRDPMNIIGLAGGSGITPFHSLARAIAEGTEDFDLTLLYGSRKADEILLKDELGDICASCGRVKVIHVLSDECKEGYENGFITAGLIKKYAPAGDYSVFVCGPQAMYAFVDPEIEKLSLPPRRVRHELFGQITHPERYPGYPSECVNKIYNVTVYIKNEKKRLACAASESLMIALERAGIAAPSRCRSGECGFCHSRLLAGNIFIPPSEDKRREADEVFGYIHPCVSFPLGDAELEIFP